MAVEPRLDGNIGPRVLFNTRRRYTLFRSLDSARIASPIVIEISQQDVILAESVDQGFNHEPQNVQSQFG